MRHLQLTLHFHGQTNPRQRRPMWFHLHFMITKRRKRKRSWMQGFEVWWTNPMSFYSWREALRSHVVGFLGKSVHCSREWILNIAILIFWLTRVWDKVGSFYLRSRDSGALDLSKRYFRTKGSEWLANVSSIDCERRAGRWFRHRPGDGGKRRTDPIGSIMFSNSCQSVCLEISVGSQ